MPLKPPEFYQGRPQTYVKHFFLERYLSELAYNVLHSWSDFVYVDGFSGPWRSEDEDLKDTSFHIAIETLRAVRDAFQTRFSQEKKVRFIFVEKDSKAFTELDKFAKTVRDVPISTIPGEFEKAIPAILDKIGSRAFSLIFIDPTGWTGFGLREITPLLQLRGETLINFNLSDFSRFLEEATRRKASSYDSCFGGSDWYDEYTDLTGGGLSREDALLETYRRRVKRFGSIDYVTTARIKKPYQERAYFHLVYGTRSWKGVHVFRKVEKKTVPLEERVRAEAQAKLRDDPMAPLLFVDLPVAPGTRAYEQERTVSRSRGKAVLLELLRHKRRMPYRCLSAEVMQMPLVWKSDLDSWLNELRANDEIRIEGLSGRATVPKPANVVVYLGRSDG